MHRADDVTLRIRPTDNAPLLIFCAFTVPLPLWAVLIGGRIAWLYVLPLSTIGWPALFYAIHLATRRLRIVRQEILLQSRIATQRIPTFGRELIRLSSHHRRGDSFVRIRLSSATRSLTFHIDGGLARRYRILLSRACSRAIIFDADDGEIVRWPKRAAVADLHVRILAARGRQAAVMVLCVAVAAGLVLTRWWLSYDVLTVCTLLMVPPIVWSVVRYLESRALLRSLERKMNSR